MEIWSESFARSRKGYHVFVLPQFSKLRLLLSRYQVYCVNSVPNETQLPWFRDLGVLAVMSIVILEAAVLFPNASRKPLTQDEIYTFYVSSIRPLSVQVQALRAGADAMPPG